MSKRFGFENVDIERIKRNLKVKSTRGRKERAAHLDPLNLDSAKHLQVDIEKPLPSSNKSSPTIQTFNSQNLLPISNDHHGQPKSSPSPSKSHFDRDAPLPPLPPMRDAPKSPGVPKSAPLHNKAAGLRPLESYPYKAKSAENLRTYVAEEVPKTPASIDSPFDLRPPPPSRPLNTLAGLSELLLSQGHLRAILHDPSLFFRFTSFLNAYRPNLSPVLVRYLETQKAIKAVEYANAVAESVAPLPGDPTSNIPCAAALVDARFEQRCKRAFDILVMEALPSYITYSLVKSVTECMVKEVTGIQMPFMRELLSGLTEVFCLCDPNIKDCPIIYASDEFHRMTQYGRDYAIGRNCRFLQGPKTNPTSLNRLHQAIKDGQEICETILNYRRDGSPFINLLLMCPLTDNKGRVKYFIGAQVDVSGLVKDGLGLETFERFLAQERKIQQESEKKAKSFRDSSHSRDSRVLGAEKALAKLKELSEMFSVEETNAVETHSRTNSFVRDERPPATSLQNRPRHKTGPGGRRVLIDGSRSDSDEGDEPRARLEKQQDKNRWTTLSSLGPSGKLPGVYSNYLLIRPAPSLRIIFTSPSLQGVGNLVQTQFMSHVSGPSSTLRGLEEAFISGVPVTAKISWYPNGKPDNLRSESRLANGTRSPEPGEDSQHNSLRGQPRWISATPLLGSDDRVGVWMILLVEKGSYGTIKQRIQSPTPAHNAHVAYTAPIIPNGIGERRERRILDGTTSAGTGDSKAKRVLDLSVSHPLRPTHHSTTATVLDTEDELDDFASVTSAAINGVVTNSTGRHLVSSGADSGIGHAEETSSWNPKKDETIRIPITNGLYPRSQASTSDMRKHRQQESNDSDAGESLMRVPALAPKRSVTPNEERTFSL